MVKFLWKKVAITQRRFLKDADCERGHTLAQKKQIRWHLVVGGAGRATPSPNKQNPRNPADRYLFFNIRCQVQSLVHHTNSPNTIVSVSVSKCVQLWKSSGQTWTWWSLTVYLTSRTGFVTSSNWVCFFPQRQFFQRILYREWRTGWCTCNIFRHFWKLLLITQN